MSTLQAAPAQKITPFLWFESQAEEAARFYVSLFDNSAVTQVVRCGPGGPVPEGTVMTVAFRLAGQAFVALNGGKQIPFTDAVSFVINCHTQAEIDTLWTQLSAAGGATGPCSWLKDRYGLSWQVVPAELPELLSGPDAESAARVMQALCTMHKIDLETLRQAHAGGELVIGQ
ncbi:MAG: VOC family protein [Cytophagales bacterium]|nr:VOC family protein [Cytophagales bacterium]